MLGHPEAEFSPTGAAYVCEVGGQVVVRSFAPDRRSLDLINLDAHAIEKASIQRIDGKTWQAIRRQFPDLPSRQADPRIADPIVSASDTYSIDEAIRDLGFRLGDAKGLLNAAQASARSEQWDAAKQAVEEAVRHGASGAGVQFLRGGIAIRERRYGDAVSDFSSAWNDIQRSSEPGENRNLDGPRATSGLAQALIGSGRFSEVGVAFEKSISMESVPMSLARKTYSMLATAAGGDILIAKERFRELMAQNRKGDFRDQCDYVAPDLVIVGVALDLIPELPQPYLPLPADFKDVGLPTAMLEFARTGQFEAASNLRGSLEALPPTPQFLLADALIAKHVGADEFRNKLRACIQGCQTIAKQNDCSNIDVAMIVCQAHIFEREAKQYLDALSRR
jgi:hypothetical protein